MVVPSGNVVCAVSGGGGAVGSSATLTTPYGLTTKGGDDVAVNVDAGTGSTSVQVARPSVPLTPVAAMRILTRTHDATFCGYSICTTAVPDASVVLAPTMDTATSDLRGSIEPLWLMSSTVSRTPLRLMSSLAQPPAFSLWTQLATGFV